jgi:transglutaminase-like putative cysteine protease
MRFQIHHRTHYRYAGEASESFMEARLEPVTTARQRVVSYRLEVDPATNLHSYVDYFGNAVKSFSVVRRHASLTLDSYVEVETLKTPPPTAAMEVSVSEGRQIYRSEKLRFFEFLSPSDAIPFSAEIHQLANKFFRPRDEIGKSALELNHWINQEFAYRTGSTRIDTPIAQVLQQRAGVCQDFAQIMIAILRSAEIPARYVVGYIETDDQRKASATTSKRPKKLVGTAESHAWVELCLPGGEWWPLDPTNDCTAGQRHVRVSTGRDYLDCSPTRGVFKGTQTETLKATVTMLRTSPDSLLAKS